MIINEVKCRSILNKSGIPGTDYSLNPYIGCSHKCQYCYAVFMKKFTGHTEPWGDFVDAKVNAADVLRRQIRRSRPGRISIGTACDPYQPVETKFGITRQCLEVLADYKPFEISVITKSHLATRDIDLFKKFRKIEIGFSITHINPRVTRVFEPGAPSSEKRLEALKILNRHSIPTWIFIAPVLPGLTDTDSDLNQLFRAARIAGVSYLFFDTLNPYPKVWKNVLRLIKIHFPELMPVYQRFYRNKRDYEMGLGNKLKKYSRYFQVGASFAFSC
jgi:DNA repair photolyase